MADPADLEKVLGVHFKDPSLLKQAIIHDSYVNENPGLVPISNERFEFLGDAVLNLIFADKLLKDFPQASEGELTHFRSLMVRGSTLARLAKEIKLGAYLYLGRGEELSGGRFKSTNLAAALEAVIAAIYLDRGMAVAREFTLSLFHRELEKLGGQEALIDYKSQLQHIIQARQQETPSYRIVAATGPDHEPHFTAEAMVGDTVLGEGSGKSKKEAEAAAAKAALEKLKASFT